MKKKYLILTLCVFTAFTSCKKEDNVTPQKNESEIVDGNTDDGNNNSTDNTPKYDKVKTYISYAEDGITEISRQEYEYDAYGRTIGYKNYINGNLSQENTNYVYDGLIGTYVSNSYQNNEIISFKKHKIEFFDSKFDKTKISFSYLEDGVTEFSHQEYEYDAQGRTISFKNYFYGSLSQEYTNYIYDGLTQTYIYNYYSNNEISSSLKYKNEYFDSKYDKTKTLIAYAEGGETEFFRQEYEYNAQGREIGFVYYYNGNLVQENTNYVYDGLTQTYVINSYQNNEIISSRKNKVTYLQ